MLLSNLIQPILTILGLGSRLQTDHYVSSDMGLSSVSTLIEGTNSAVLIDPSFFLTDAAECAEWIKKKIGNKELVAVFITHHHPDHYFGANAILDAFPKARFYATPPVLQAINKEIEGKIPHWRGMFGPERIPLHPKTPEPFYHTFFTLEGDESSPIHLLAPLQGDTVDHTIFWLPRERVIVAGDAVYGRTHPLWLEEAATPALANSWENSLLFLKSLNPTKVYPGHVARGIILDGHTDIDYSLAYLRYFHKNVLEQEGKIPPNEIYDSLRREFPDAIENLEFLLNRTAENFGKDGLKWPENDMQNVKDRIAEQLDAYILRIKGVVGKMKGLSHHDEL